MTVQKFFTSRVKQTTGSTYVGEKGRMFYDETIKSLRVSDGITPGGQSILFTTLSANIGNLYVTGANISSINPNEDINLITNGTGNVKVIGEFFVTQTDGTPLIDSLANGTINFYVPVQNTVDSGVDIIGTPGKAVVAPQNVGVMLHITGQPSLPSRLYNDGANAYAFYGGRRYNGTASSPTGVQSNTLVTRYGSTPYHSTGWPTVSTARMEMYTTENQTSSNQGSNIALWTTPIGSNTITQVASFDDRALTVTGNVVAGNVSGTKGTFTTVAGNLTGNVVGKATQLATNGTTAIGTFLAGRLSAATGSVAKNSVATATYTITGLTTSHNIIITPGTAMPDRQFNVTAAWASAADTVSIQYANNTGGAISVTLDINYLAFV